MRAPSHTLLRHLRVCVLGKVCTAVERPLIHSPAITGQKSTFHPTQPIGLTNRRFGGRGFSSTVSWRLPPAARTPNLAPKSRDRGPASKEDTQTDFGNLNVLGNTAPPAAAVDACLSDGFHLSNGIKIAGGSGCLLVGGEVFSWRPWDFNGQGAQTSTGRKNMVNEKGQWEISQDSWAIFELLWPKPELLIIGTGGNILPLSSRTRKHINDIGIRVDVLDTRNASAQFNLLATERGVGNVAAALLPVGWKI